MKILLGKNVFIYFCHRHFQYSFCKYMDYYVSMENRLSTGYQSIAYKRYCDFNFDNFEKKSDLEVLCAKFKYFYSLLFFDPFGINAYRNNENCEYLSFWLNKEFKNGNISSISIPDFYLKLKSNDTSFDRGNKLKGKMLVIEQEELKIMNTLYDLYNIYNKIIYLKVEDQKTCNDYYSVCVKKYTDSMGNCSNKEYTNFCNALKSFKEKYEKINSVSMGVCRSKDILPLPSEQILLEDKDHVTEQLVGEEEQSLESFSSHLLGIQSQEMVADPVQDEIKDSVKGEKKVSVKEETGETQQPLSLSVEGKPTDNYNRVVSGAGTMLGAFSICMIMYKVKYIPYKNINIAKN
ncbi:hypothetical protein PVBG_04825 [Plasmodium vivax Brazil I]|uniref:Uncharacterized protein n=1 Tax=Plasmodium vivax (strain Brazil I) TaxID=1033975 RepID=A0A0J9T0R3_PLAV1|nr:hypothetical protein PVBG_04825 [Plasmodium vivax Brazil I]